MAQVYARLSDYTRKKDGKKAILIYSSENKDRTYPSIGYHVRPEDFENGFVKPSHPDHKNINSLIRKKVGEAESDKLVAIASGEKFSPKRSRAKGITFYAFCKKEVEGISGANSTKSGYDTQLRKVLEFDSTTKASKIGPSWVNSYRIHLEKKYPGKAAMAASFIFLTRMEKGLRREKLIKSSIFEDVDKPKPGAVGTKRRFLVAKERSILEENFASMPARRYRAVIWFLYGCYSGLRYSDWSLDTVRKFLSAGAIERPQTKTRNHVVIPIYPKLRDVMEKIVTFNKGKWDTTNLNKIMKEVAQELNINPHISSHFARHSFGVFLADNDIPPQVAQKLLGHKNIKETMIYYEVTPAKVASVVESSLGDQHIDGRKALLRDIRNASKDTLLILLEEIQKLIGPE